MSHKQIIKKSPYKKKIDRQNKHLILHSRSKQKSSSGDEKKSQSSLKKIFYKHQIFDKRNSVGKFKTLQRIKQEKVDHLNPQYKSSQQIMLKTKGVSILQNQHGKFHETDKIQRFLLKQSRQKSQQNQNSRKNIEILQIETHQILEQKQENTLRQSIEGRVQVITTYKPSQNRDGQIMQHKYQSNLKFLMAQTSQLLSYSKFLVIEDQFSQIKRKISELNISIRKLKIEMRNHDYTKEINFTFPVQKHNDQILVKMPRQIQEKEMNKYYLMVQKLQKQNKIFKQQNEKINNLESYYETLVKKYQSKQSSQKIGNNKLSGINKNVQLKKSTSSQQISIKSSKIISSFQSNNSKTSNKNIISKSIIPSLASQKQILQKRYQTLVQKKDNLKDNVYDLKINLQDKTVRLIEQINLLKKQISLIELSLKTTEQNKMKLDEQLAASRKLKSQNEQNNIQSAQVQYISLANEKRLNYEKQKQQRNIESKGFTMNLRQNKSLSPSNYLSNLSSNKIISQYSPRNMTNKNVIKVNRQKQDIINKNNIENIQITKSNKIK